MEQKGSGDNDSGVRLANEIHLAAGAESTTRRFQSGEVSTVAEAQRKPTMIKAGDGMVIQIALGDFIKVVGAIILAAFAYWGIVSELRDIKRAQGEQAKQSGELREQLKEFNDKFDGKWLMQQYDLYDIKIALARAGLWNGSINPPVGTGTVPLAVSPRPNQLPKGEEKR